MRDEGRGKADEQKSWWRENGGWREREREEDEENKELGPKIKEITWLFNEWGVILHSTLSSIQGTSDLWLRSL